MHSARPPSAPPTTSASHARPSPVQTSQHNHDSQGVTYSGRFAAQLQNQPLQPPPSAVAVGARAASVSTTQTRRTMVQRVWSVRRPSIIQSQFYQAPPAAQQQPPTKSRSLHAGPTSAAHHKPTAPVHFSHHHARAIGSTEIYTFTHCTRQHSHVLMACGAVIVQQASGYPAYIFE